MDPKFCILWIFFLLFALISLWAKGLALIIKIWGQFQYSAGSVRILALWTFIPFVLTFIIWMTQRISRGLGSVRNFPPPFFPPPPPSSSFYWTYFISACTSSISHLIWAYWGNERWIHRLLLSIVISRNFPICIVRSQIVPMNYLFQPALSKSFTGMECPVFDIVSELHYRWIWIPPAP